MKLWMSDRDICDMYKRAVNQQEQIKILTQLNDCSQAQIRDILERHGFVPVKPRVAKRRETPHKPWEVAELIQLLYLLDSGMSNEKLAKHFDRTEKAVIDMRRKLKTGNTQKAVRALEAFKRAKGVS